MSDPTPEPPSQDSQPATTSSWGSVFGVVFGVVLLVGVWAGGTWLAHQIWDTSWFVSTLLAPVAVVATYVVIKLWTFLR